MKKDYLLEVFQTFGTAILVISAIGLLAGENMKHESIIYQLGNQGIAYNTLFQIFLFAVIAAGVEQFFKSDFLSHKMSYFLRTCLLFLTLLILTVTIAIIFQWIPIKMKAIVFFSLSFGISYIICCVIFGIRYYYLEKKYNKLLKKYQKRKAEEIKK